MVEKALEGQGGRACLLLVHLHDFLKGHAGFGFYSNNFPGPRKVLLANVQIVGNLNAISLPNLHLHSRT